MKFSLLIFVFLAANLTNAQNKVAKSEDILNEHYFYKWDETFDKSKYENVDHEGSEATIVFDRTILAHRPKEGADSRLPFRKKFTHQIYWIHEESAIEKMNEVYLYESGSSKVSKVMVRTIDKAGNVVEFDDSKLEEVSKNEGNSNYKILAIPGIEVGSWVEILIDYDGFPSQNRILTREPFDVISSEVIFYTALPLQMRDGKVSPAMKGFNGYNLESNDVLEGGRLCKVYKATNIPAQITDETYMHEYAECPRVDLTTSPYVWRDMSNGIYRNYLALETVLNRSGKVRKLLTEIGADFGSELSKIEAIERYIKEQITETEEEGIQFQSSQRVIKSKVANTTGIMMLYKTLLENCEIEYKPYLVYDKDYILPTKDMPMTLGLSDFVIYFPNSDVYVMPESNYYRVGKLSKYLSGVPALYLRDNFGKVNEEYLTTLPAAEKEYNVDKSINRLTYSEEDESLTVQTAKQYYGDRAIIERGSLHFMDQSEKDERVKEILLSTLENAKLTDVQMKNTEIGYNANSKDSVILSGTIVTEDMISPIGNGFLLNLPKIIGTQVSFYDVDNRTHNVYSPVAKVYDHIIEFVIPDGYEIQGIDNLIFDRNYHYQDDEGQFKWISSFVSTAEIIDGVLTVKVHEFYEEGMFPKSEIDQYRAVVNAAYEFYIAQVKVVQK